MSSDFEKLIDANMRAYVSGMLQQQMQPGYEFIKSEYDIAQGYYMASLKYEIAQNYQNAANAIIAGGIAICTFAVGGWIITAASTQTTVLGSGVLMGSGGVPIYGLPTVVTTAPSLAAKLGISATLGGLGIATNAFITGAIGTGEGSLKAMDAPKLGLLVAGGAAKVGPFFGLLFGTAGGVYERALRAALLEEMSKNEVKEFAKKTLKAQIGQIGGKVSAAGRKGKLAFAPIDDLNQKMRMPALRKITELTDDFMKNDKSLFSSPNRNHIHSAIHAKVGTEVWASVLREATQAKVNLEMESARAHADLKSAFAGWSAKAVPK